MGIEEKQSPAQLLVFHLGGSISIGANMTKMFKTYL